MAEFTPKNYLDLTGLGVYDELIKSYVDEAEAKSIHKVVVDGDVVKFYKAENPTAETQADFEVTISSSEIEDLKTKVNTITGEGEGSIKAAVKALEDGQVKINKEAIEAINNAETGILATAKADTDAKVGNLEDLATTNKGNTVAAINEIRQAVGTSALAGVVTISTDTTTEGFLKSYTVKQGDTVVGTIDVPKDLVVTGGEVVVNPEGQTAGTYIKLTIANQDAPVFINVKDLVDVYTAQASATQIQLAVSETNEISATIVAGSITATELAANAVTTEKVADGNITKAKLSTTVQASLDAADAAAQGITDAINALNATVSKVAGTDGLALEVVEENGKLKSVTGSIAENTYDAYGEASAAYAAIGSIPEASSKALFTKTTPTTED